MGDNTGIQWTDATWNPVTGCTKVSPGCKHCYAETAFPRVYGRQQIASRGEMRDRKFTDVMTHAGRLDQPLRWKRPRKIFVNSMSDLFHEDVRAEFIDRVFAVMALATQHTFQILTKRPDRMLAYLQDTSMSRCDGRGDAVTAFALKHHPDPDALNLECFGWPVPNVWLGVSCEDQQRADERIPLLLQTPAAVRFVSAEPLLGPIDFNGGDVYPSKGWLFGWHVEERHAPACDGSCVACPVAEQVQNESRVDWMIVGGESGAKARSCDIAWVRSIRDQCKAAGVACFVKQLGAAPVDYQKLGRDAAIPMSNRKGGDMTEWPGDLRVREFPS